MATKKKRPANLREACIEEAHAIIEAEGVERLSLREVARRLGVSHQAPYKHFPSRDHILAEIVARAFADFAAFMDARPKASDPGEDLLVMSRAYLDYAKAHPLQYRLMFGTPLPNPLDHPQMMENARHAFSLLTDALQRLAETSKPKQAEEGVLLDALFVWSALHGLSGIASGGAMKELHIPPEVANQAATHLVQRLGDAMGLSEETSGG